MALPSPSDKVYILQDFQHNTPGLVLAGDWQASVGDNFYLGTNCLFPSRDQSSLTYDFEGTEIRFFGGPSTQPSAQVTIDHNAAYDTSIGKETHSYHQLYQSPALTDDSHTIRLDDLSHDTYFDFMVITPGVNTVLEGQTLMVDDSYNGIEYTGDWQAQSNATFTINQSTSGYSLMNTTHHTSAVGDSLKFSFTGTALSLIGILENLNLGNLSLTYSIDGGNNVTQTFASNATNSYQNQPNFQLINTGPLPSGGHTLSLTLTSCFNSTLIIDYIVYTPSSETSRLPIGVIAGAVIGGVGLIAMLGSFLYLYLKRQRRSEQKVSPEATQRDGPIRPDPYTLKHGPVVAQPRRKTWLPASLSRGTANPIPPAEPGERRGTHDTEVAQPKRTSLPASLSSSTANATPPAEPGERHGPHNTEDLRRRVSELTEELRHWKAVAVPPAYSSV